MLQCLDVIDQKIINKKYKVIIMNFSVYEPFSLHKYII